MKKRVFGRKFSRAGKGRTALLRSLAREFVLHGSMTTTVARAKTLKPLIDTLVTKAKKDNLTAKRSLLAFFMNDKFVAEKLDDETKKRFENLQSGFTTQKVTGSRVGDASKLVQITWSREKKSTKETKETQEVKTA